MHEKFGKRLLYIRQCRSSMLIAIQYEEHEANERLADLHAEEGGEQLDLLRQDYRLLLRDDAEEYRQALFVLDATVSTGDNNEPSATSKRNLPLSSS